MTRQKQLYTQELNAYFTLVTFVIDDPENQPDDTRKPWTQAFETDKFSALFHLGFLKKEDWFSPSIEYLHHIAGMLIKRLSQQSDIEFTRDAVKVELLEDELCQIRDELPFVIGMEYVDDVWIHKLWEALLVA